MSHEIPEKGKCVICNTNYNKIIHQYDNDPGANEGIRYETCPKCSYSPWFEGALQGILENHAEIKFKGREVNLNVKELSELIIKELSKFWPRRRK